MSEATYELSEILSSVFALIIICSLVGGIIWGFIYGDLSLNTSSKPSGIGAMWDDLMNDKIPLGYIDDHAPHASDESTYNVKHTEEDEVASLKKQVEILKLRKQLKQLQEECTSKVKLALLEECTEVLVALGEKKTKAKEQAMNVLQADPTIKDVNDFIQKAY